MIKFSLVVAKFTKRKLLKEIFKRKERNQKTFFMIKSLVRIVEKNSMCLKWRSLLKIQRGKNFKEFFSFQILFRNNFFMNGVFLRAKSNKNSSKFLFQHLKNFLTKKILKQFDFLLFKKVLKKLLKKKLCKKF